jgi:hypothetical protein
LRGCDFSWYVAILRPWAAKSYIVRVLTFFA